MTIRSLVPLFCGLLMSVAMVGCANKPLTAQQCTTADWHKVGLQDGQNGFPEGKLQRYEADCANFDVQPNKDDYELGRQEGLLQYCTPQGGFIAGYKGHAYYDVCTEEAEKSFYPEYVLGNELNRVEQRIFELENDLYVLENDLRRYRRSSKWEDRRYRSWRYDHLYSRLHWLCAEEFRLRSAVISRHSHKLLRPRVGRFGTFY